MRAISAALACCLISLPAVVAAVEPLSEPLLNVDADRTGEQILAPKCINMAELGLYKLKYARNYQPCTDAALREWQAYMQQYRFERRVRVGYDGSRYDLPALKWTQSSFIQPQMMAYDRYFYDPQARRYSVDRYLDDVRRRYGGIDSVLVWPVYPTIGIDDRNQLDLIRSMPGGVAGLRKMVEDFHRQGVRVMFPVMLWDQGTRDPGEPWPDAVAKLMREIGADGVNGDTMDGVPRSFSDAADKIGHPLVFEPELNPHDEAVAYNLMSWGYYDYGFVPTISRYKWLEPRHLVHISDRWRKDKTDNLQFAFFGGIGWESWENIWGYWNGVTPRDGEAARRMATIERGVAPFLVSAEWEPFAPMLRYGVFASRWPLAGEAVWTIVNRNDYDITGAQLKAEPDWRYFDLYHGVELTPQQQSGSLVLSFAVEAKGYGAVLASKHAPDAAILRLMTAMRGVTVKPLASFSNQWVVLPQTIAPIALAPLTGAAPAGMIKVPAGDYLFRVNGIEIEGSENVGIDVQYPWENSPRLFHEQPMAIKSYWIDRYPVTNRQYKEFVEATSYQPADNANYLRDWRSGNYPDGWAEKPVTWVSREDAQAYARWAGKRLPREWEWQYAAQGNNARLYPWGNHWQPTAVPVPDKGRKMRGPDDVSAHPRGASPFGVEDLVGNVWQWTDEFADDHTRSAVLRGGSYYQPQNAVWYFPQAYQLNQHGKFLLMSPGMDRSGAVGFRCVADAAQ